MPTAAPRGAAVGTRSSIDSTGSRLGEPGDHHAEGIAPEQLRGWCERRPAQLDRRQSLAEGVELERCFTDAALADEALSGERLEAPVQHREGTRGGGTKMRPRFGVRALNADREECWVLEREAPEHQRRIGQVGAWIVRHGERFETF